MRRVKLTTRPACTDPLPDDLRNALITIRADVCTNVSQVGPTVRTNLSQAGSHTAAPSDARPPQLFLREQIPHIRARRIRQA
jgi:hypothetical protein